MTAVLEHAAIKPRTYWADDAACRTEDVELFFGTENHPLLGRTAALPGLRICWRCPVRRDCLLDSLIAREWVGLRGGFLGAERRRTLKAHGGSVEAAMAAYDDGTFIPGRG